MVGTPSATAMTSWEPRTSGAKGRNMPAIL
jgi:hypothetical protein